MGIMSWITYLFCGFILFIILNVINNKYNITKIEKMIISIIFMMIISGICFRCALNYTDNIFIIFVFLMIIEIIYSNYILDRDFFDKDSRNIEYYILLIIIGFIVNQEFINNVTEVFLTGEDLRIVLWFLSFIFVFNFFKDRKILEKKDNLNKSNFMSEEAILISFVKLKNQFNNILNCDDKDLTNILYSIMIYENNKRSKIMRSFDYIKFRFTGTKSRLGIMQVESDKFISDSESIEIVYKNLETLYNKKNIKTNKAYEVIKKYTNNNLDIKFIFDVIEKF